MRTDIVSGIDEIEAGEWDALADGSFYSSAAWMRYQEAADGVTTRYVLVRDEHGRLAAAAPVYVVISEGSSMYAPGRLFPELQDRPGAAGRTVLVGNRRGYANRLLVGGPPEHRGRAVKQLVDAVNLIAAEEADGRAWWLYLGDGDTEALLAHAPHPVPRLVAADCAITLPGTGFDDYLRGGSGNMRRQIRKDREAFAGAGYTVSRTSLSESWPEISPLIASHQAHHGEPSQTALISRLMRAQAEATGEAGTVHACHREGRMVGCTLTYSTPYEVSSRAYGFDHRLPATAAEYFELLYYRPMEAAYRTGARRLHLGIGTLLPKIRRGAEVSLLWAVTTGHAHADETVRLARAHNSARWHSMAGEMGSAAARVVSPLLERPMGTPILQGKHG
ncbi:GNAT family N-acetyltransferase, partial [Streptomyces sp. SID7982]|nr:GNAT family N-acetyltransferase [Streptomyces sp. SID7982]